MIIANILKDLFKCLELDYFEYNRFNEVSDKVKKQVKFSFGNQDDLNKYISSRLNLDNFPLIWYVKPNFEMDSQRLDVFNVKAKLILMTSTKADTYNEDIAVINYENLLHPLSLKVIKVLEKARNIDIKSKISVFDETKFGLDVYNSNMDTKTKSGTLMYVDSRVLEVELEIKKKCQ